MRIAALLATVGILSIALVKGANREDALCKAAAAGREADVRSLLEKGANPNVAARFHRKQINLATPLIAASINGHASIVRILLAAGARPDATVIHGWSALHGAADYGHLETVTSLLEGGANPNLALDDGSTAARLAVSSDHFEIGKLLLSRTSRTPLIIAVDFGSSNFVRSLIAAGVSVNETNEQGETAFIVASRNSGGVPHDHGGHVRASTSSKSY